MVREIHLRPEDVKQSVLPGALPRLPGDPARGAEEELHQDAGEGRDQQGHHGPDRRGLGRVPEEGEGAQPGQEEGRDGENTAHVQESQRAVRRKGEHRGADLRARGQADQEARLRPRQVRVRDERQGEDVPHGEQRGGGAQARLQVQEEAEEPEEGDQGGGRAQEEEEGEEG